MQSTYRHYVKKPTQIVGFFNRLNYLINEADF